VARTTMQQAKEGAQIETATPKLKTTTFQSVKTSKHVWLFARKIERIYQSICDITTFMCHFKAKSMKCQVVRSGNFCEPYDSFFHEFGYQEQR